MEITYDQKIINIINYLEQRGYKVIKDNSSVVGKWVAFRQEGMEPILHGRVRSVTIIGTCTIRCKNGERRFCNVEDILSFFDNKKECYEYR